MNNDLYLDDPAEAAADVQNADLRDLDIRNDFMFSYVMRDPKICIALLEYLLPGCRIDRIKYYRVNDSSDRPVMNPQEELLVETQKALDDAPGKHGVRLDAYLDDGKSVYNIELQNDFQDYLPKRARLYQSHLDINQLRRGQTYDTLRPCFVVFICTFDPFKKGLYRYSFHNVCQEDATLKLNDGACKLFFNTKGKRGDISEDLREVLKYINNPGIYPVKETNLTLIRAIDEAVSEAKMNDDWRVAYMTYQIHQRDAELRGEKRGIAIGRQEGRQEGIGIGEVLGAIKVLRKTGMDDSNIKTMIMNNFNLSASDAAKYMEMPTQQSSILRK